MGVVRALGYKTIEKLPGRESCQQNDKPKNREMTNSHAHKSHMHIKTQKLEMKGYVSNQQK